MITVTGGFGSIRVSVYVALPAHPYWSVAVTVNVLLTDVGVPDNVPLLDNVIPAGKLPPVWLKVYGAVPPDAVKFVGP